MTVDRLFRLSERANLGAPRGLQRDRPLITSRVVPWRPGRPRKISHLWQLSDRNRTRSDPRGRNPVYAQYTRNLRPNTPKANRRAEPIARNAGTLGLEAPTASLARGTITAQEGLPGRLVADK